MATDYPTTIDTFVNPTATDQMSAPPHAAQHADANDAIIAIQTKIGVNGSADLLTIEGRLGAAEADIDQLEIDVPAIDGRLVTAEGEIDTLQTDVNTINTTSLPLKVDSNDVDTIVQITQAAYDALGTPDARTLYVIIG